MELKDTLALILSTISLIVASFSLVRNRKVAHYQKVYDLRSDYESREMSESLIALNNWINDAGPDYAEIYGLRLHGETEGARSEFHKIHMYRRTISHFFHKVKNTYKQGGISQKEIRGIVSPESVAYLLDKIQPIEEKLRSNYNTSTFDFFRELYKNEIKQGAGEFVKPKYE